MKAGQGSKENGADVPLRPGLFHLPESADEKPSLLGSRCRVCGYVSFPRKRACVRCRRDDTMEDRRLGPYGTLETYAVMRVGPPDFPPPYMVGYVRLNEGPVVFTQITGCEMKDDALKIGTEMELVITHLKTDPEGNNLIGWKFRPKEDL